jgi:hypothetical protein
MSESDQHQLLITLVHGTWPRGFFRTFFWTPRRRHPSPLWFEDGSPFLSRLSAELHDISHKITPLLWSGENSISERDKAAHVLAEYLLDEHAQHPQATQLVIAHSHGGNVALRALHHLQKREAAQLCEEERANPFIVTLATPFVEVHPADFGQRPLYTRLAVLMAISSLLGLVPGFIWDKPDIVDNLLSFIVHLLGFGCLVLTWRWGLRWINRGTARQEQVNALKDATQLGELVSVSAKRLLVIRAIDDEASLVLAVGTIVSYVTARVIKYVYILLALLSVPGLISLLAKSAVGGVWLVFSFLPLRPSWTWLSGTDLSISPAIIQKYIASIALLVGLFMGARAFHGRELARSPMECQINTNSTPDAKGLSGIITLVRRTYVRSLRHGIYDHEDCAKEISDWVRSQLCAPPMRWELAVPGARKGSRPASYADQGSPIERLNVSPECLSLAPSGRPGMSARCLLLGGGADLICATRVLPNLTP